MDLNKAMIIGRLTRDPEIRTTPQGTQVASFSVATNYSWKDAAGNRQDKSEYHNVVAWRKLAEICGQYLKKASRVYIEGRLQTRSWDDQSGQKKYRTEIVADNMIMLDAKGSAPAAAPFGASNAATATTPAADKQFAPPPPAEDEIRIEDIPF